MEKRLNKRAQQNLINEKIREHSMTNGYPAKHKLW